MSDTDKNPDTGAGAGPSNKKGVLGQFEKIDLLDKAFAVAHAFTYFTAHYIHVQDPDRYEVSKAELLKAKNELALDILTFAQANVLQNPHNSTTIDRNFASGAFAKRNFLTEFDNAVPFISIHLSLQIPTTYTQGDDPCHLPLKSLFAA